MATHRQPASRKLHSYKEERLRSARKDINQSISISHDLDQIQSTIKTSLSRRLSNPTLNLMRMSLQKEICRQPQTPKSCLQDSTLRLSNVNDKFIAKYMNKYTNIVQVSQQDQLGSVLLPKSISTNVVLKGKKKMYQSMKVERAVPINVKCLGKMTESRVVTKKDRRKVSKIQISKTIKKLESIQQEVDRMELACGRQVAAEFLKIITRLREE